jgi:hypothetical protein
MLVMKRVYGEILRAIGASVMAVLLLSSNAWALTPTSPAASQIPAPNRGDIVLDKNGSGGPVCLAVPVLSTGATKGGCQPGEVEISNDAAQGGAIISYLKLLLVLINGLVGGIIILVIVIAGIQYITSAGDPTRIKSAKNRLTQAFTGLFLYLMMNAILNFLIPGGAL